MKRRRVPQALLMLMMLAGTPPAVIAQQPPTTGGTAAGPAAAAPPVPADSPSAIDDTMTAAESDAPARRLIKFNEFEGPLGSIRLGFGLLVDYATFDQDEASKEQVEELGSSWEYRDGRLLLSGRLNFTRQTTWSAGIMYDAGKEQWVLRQTGIMVAVPEIWGHIFVGRTKEGFSLNKVMIGYAGWAMERSQMSDATQPILADGVKWLGYAPKARTLWSLGFYGDALSEGQSFSSYENQLVGRVAWLPVLSTDGGNLVHLAIAGRVGKVNDGTLRLRARPGAWAAPYFIDTGEFAADSTMLTGAEVYYRPGSWTFGSEYYWQNVDAPESGNPMFHGGDVFASWLITGEVRAYNTRGGYFNQVSPRRPVFSGGPGAWELVAQFTTSDLDSGTITGGRYWRFTPTVNWYLSDNLRLEGAYGYGSLDRFEQVGTTQFLQFRLQIQL